MRWWFPGFALAAILSAANEPRIVYTKVFPGSATPYIGIWVDKTGHGEFNDSPDGKDPISFSLKKKETAEIFSLAGKVGDFTRPLESNLKVAKMGMKTFRYEDGPKRSEVKFNYSTDTNAQLLLNWFERITETAEHAVNIERAAQFDRLGVDRALILLEVSVEQKRLAGGDMLLPVLDRIAKHSVYINRARERAATIAEYIREGSPNSQ